MPIELIEITRSSTDGSPNLPDPTLAEANDVFILAYDRARGSSGTTIPAISGWTLLNWVMSTVRENQLTGVYWHRYDGVSFPTFTVPDAGEENSLIMYVFRGCALDGSPIKDNAVDVDGVVDNGSDNFFPAINVDDQNLCLFISIQGTNSTSRMAYLGTASADLSDVTSPYDDRWRPQSSVGIILFSGIATSTTTVDDFAIGYGGGADFYSAARYSVALIPLVLPEIIDVDAAATSAYTADVTIEHNSSAGTVYWTLSTNPVAPTPEQVEGGLDEDGSAALLSVSKAVTEAATEEYSVESLQGSTTYYVYSTKVLDTNYADVVSDSFTTPVAPSDIEYRLKFERHLAPIFKRGRARLTEALPAGSFVEVLRKTPIVNDFNAVERQPFPSGEFEYALDKICFIQQEIEGHFCACPDYPEYPIDPPGPPVTPPTDPNPQCLPYSCSAFLDYMEEVGIPTQKFYKSTTDAWEWPFASTPGEFNKNSAYADFVSGATLLTDWPSAFGNTNSSFNRTTLPGSFEETKTPNICEESIEQILLVRGRQVQVASTEAVVPYYGDNKKLTGNTVSMTVTGYGGVGPCRGRLFDGSGGRWSYDVAGSGGFNDVIQGGRVSVNNEIVTLQIPSYRGDAVAQIPVPGINTSWRTFIIQHKATPPFSFVEEGVNRVLSIITLRVIALIPGAKVSEAFDVTISEAQRLATSGFSSDVTNITPLDLTNINQGPFCLYVTNDTQQFSVLWLGSSFYDTDEQEFEFDLEAAQAALNRSYANYELPDFCTTSGLSFEGGEI